MTSTGFGDGEYSINGAVINGAYYAVQVNFIEYEDEDYED